MEIIVHRKDDQVTHLALAGRLDVIGVQAIELHFIAHTASRRKPAVVDVAQVTFLSSLGVRMLLSTAKALMPHGAKLVLLNPQPQVLQVLELGQLVAIIPVETDLAAALKSLGVN
ncbi:MAG: STAS domain-containing protein [Opitutales bacterium]|jgi:anti-anti-sigma factor